MYMYHTKLDLHAPLTDVSEMQLIANEADNDQH